MMVNTAVCPVVTSMSPVRTKAAPERVAEARPATSLSAYLLRFL